MYFTKCGNENHQIFEQNVAGSAQIGHLLHEGDGYCAVGNELIAYGCEVGAMGIANGARKLYYKKLLIIDSRVGVALKLARKGRDLNAFVQNSFISAIERPSCPDCFGENATKCRNNEGIKMFVATEDLPQITNYSSSLAEVMSQGSFDSKAFITDVKFKNFNYHYSEAELSECGQNFMFRPPKTASELIASHHLQNVSCINCSSNSYIYFDEPSQEYVGQEKECGQIPCSGKLNYFIKDHDGTLLGQEGSLIPENEIGNYTENCVFNEDMNGFQCLKYDFVVLEYESFAPDYNSRKTWPVSIHPISNY